MARRSLPLNTARQLWAQCAGYCQNPACNKPLFRSVDDEAVSLANVAHIIGHGTSGPRSDHELAEFIDRDGFDNLVMLCLECHKVIDELEGRFSVETIKSWKQTHSGRIASLFSTPSIRDENELLAAVNDLLDENSIIFREYGPWSKNALSGEGGDGLRIWRQRCLDTIIPNNQRIVQLIENNKRSFPYPWEVYQRLLSYKVHVDAFRDNCLTDRKINDYKLFPQNFDYYVKTKLGISSKAPEVRAREEIEFRHNQVRTFIERFLSSHNSIANLQELNRGTMLIELRDGRTLKVFVTNTYVFTDYTLERVLETDPAVDAIICSCPAGCYTDSAKRLCIEKGVGLFMLGEFMGAIQFTGEQYLNFLVRAEREDRLNKLKRMTKKCSAPTGLCVFAFGSFLRRKLYRDIDLFVVYKEPAVIEDVKNFVAHLSAEVRATNEEPDITVASEREFLKLKLTHDNLTQVLP